jgi:hypothetical protein
MLSINQVTVGYIYLAAADESYACDTTLRKSVMDVCVSLFVIQKTVANDCT